MLPSRTGNRQRKKSGKKNQLYKPKIEYTDDGFVVTTLYIKSLGKEITRSHLVDYFTKYGKVQHVRIHTKANGFGFVTFARPEAASKVLQCRFHKINGKEVTIAIADSWHQEKPLEQYNNNKTKPVKLPIELTNTTGTYLMDLNDDCLYEIFSHTSSNIMDLCSVAETCTRLKAIATRIFAKLHKSCKFNEMSLQTIHEMRRMLINFGSSITDLTIGPSYELEQHYDGMAARVLDLVIRCCSKTLESLRLKDFQISDHLIKNGKLRPMFGKLKLLHIENGYIGDGKQLFAQCASLVELKVIDWENDENGMIFENKFPKLERFKYQSSYDDYDDYDLETFVSNHKGLKEFSMGTFHSDCSPLLPVIAKNCTDLEKLNITGHSNDSPYNYVKALKSLLALKKLTKLKIKCDKENVTKFLKELPQLNSLEYLELWYAQSDAEFIPALSQLKNLKVLRLRDCNHLKNVNALANLEKLTELSILIRSPTAIVDIEIDIVALVKRLTDLAKLTIGLHSIKVDRQMYLRLVSVVRERPGRLPSSLEVKAFSIEHQAFDLQLDGKNHELVTLEHVPLYDSEYDSENDSDMSDEYSDSDFEPYFLDDGDSDDYHFPAAFLLPYLQHQLMNHFGGGSDDEDSDDGDDDNEAEDEDTEVW